MFPSPSARGHGFVAAVSTALLASLLIVVAPPARVAAAAGNGLQFNGSSQYVTFGAATGASGLTAATFTLELWFERTGPGVGTTTGTGGITSAIPLLTKGRAEAETPANVNMNYFLGLDATTGQLVADFEDSATGLNHPVTGTAVVSQNVWHHAAVTFGASTWNLYLDGVLDKTLGVGAFTPEATSIQHAALGTAMTSTGVAAGFFQGMVDEPRIWNVVRTAAQISANKGLELTSGTGLIGRWGLNEASGTSAANSISGRPTGTLVGSPTRVAGFPNTAIQAPVAVADSYSTPLNTTLTVAAPGVLSNDSDPDGNAITAVKVTNPAHGTATLSANGALTYVPTTGYSGADSFTYKANDGLLDSNTVTVSLTVTTGSGSNKGLDFSSASSQYVTFGDPAALDLSTYTIETWFRRDGPGVGVTTGTNGIALAIPLVTHGSQEAESPANVNMDWFFGLDASSAVLVADFEEATGPNHPISGTTPIVTGTWYHAAATYDGTTWRLYLNGNLEATVVANATPEAATIQPAALATAIRSTGSPNGYFDGVLDEVRVWNIARSQAQIQASKNLELTSGTGLVARWGLNEGSGTTVQSSVGSLPGTLTNGPTWVAGSPSIGGGSNQAPVAVADSYSTPLNTTLTVAAPGLLSNDSDPDGNPITAIKVSDPTHGTATVAADGSLSYVPTTGYSGADSFTYKANDGSLDSNTVTVSLTVTGVNHAPVAVADAYNTPQDTTLVLGAPGVLGNDTDQDGNSLSAIKVTDVTHGTLALASDGSFTYVPTAGYNGPDSFTYKANDGALDSSTVTVTISIGAANHTPVAVADSYLTNQGQTLNIVAPGVLGNDTDQDGNPLTAIKDSNPAHGTLTLNANGSFTYVPTAGYSGPDSFLYQASDGALDSIAATVSLTVRATPAQGYWMVASDGGIFTFGNAGFFGSTGGRPLDQPIVGMATTPSGSGYWLVASDGGIFAFGDALFYGSKGGQHLDKPVVAMAATPTGHGYWLVASDGGIFNFGDALFYGSKGGQPLDKPIVGMTATRTGQGYWLVASDGGIFSFGDALYYGSTGGQRLDKPIVGMTVTPSSHGYWLVASDGGIFTFGDASFYGSTGGQPLDQPVVAMTATASGRGYWLTASDGGIFAFGDAQFYGSMGGQHLDKPVLGMAGH